MKRFILSWLSVASVIALAAQTNFTEGYLVAENGTRQEIQLKVPSPRINPSSIRYRQDGNDKLLAGNLTTVREFGDTAGKFRYVRAIVDVDRSSDDAKRLSYSSRPEFVRDTVFLRVLIDGSATLYSWQAKDLERYYYRTEKIDDPQPLIHRRYAYRNEAPGSSGRSVREVNTFRAQIQKDLRCEGSNQENLAELEYQAANLINYFTSYNECKGGESKIYFENNRLRVEWSLLAGLDYGRFAVSDVPGGPVRLEREKAELDFRVGIEVEAYLPYGKGKWALPLQVVYRNFRATSDASTLNRELKFSGLTASLGIRRYFQLANSARVFVNGYLDANLPFSATLGFPDGRNINEVRSSIAFTVGGGIRLFERLRLELRYYPSYNVIPNFVNITGKYQGVGIMGGYRF